MRLLGIVSMVIGVLLLLFGFNASRGIKEKIMKGFTGHFTRNTMIYLIAGIILIIGGGALFLYSDGLQKI